MLLRFGEPAKRERVPQSLEELCLSQPPRVKEPVLPESGRLPAGTAPAASDSSGAGFTGRNRARGSRTRRRGSYTFLFRALTALVTNMPAWIALAAEAYFLLQRRAWASMSSWSSEARARWRRRRWRRGGGGRARRMHGESRERAHGRRMCFMCQNHGSHSTRVCPRVVPSPPPGPPKARAVMAS